ncbi:MAG: Zn-dependent exopeptidase M28 [Ignavibacteriae bacterium]|nr:MAG: Zn-dependent exopeptidase M28 [Ignavibacteriota bacterium]
MKRLLFFILLIPSFVFSQTPFSTESALSYLKHLSVTIGARPMGSPNERQAMVYALDKFREFGLTDVSIMEIAAADNDMTRSSSNTRTGVVIGVLHGKTNRIIVVGGHIDSAGPEIPGANDDGSGAASVIELARVLSKEQHQSTIVFCLFGGEEAGLVGSKYFVQHFQQLDSVALMLELDMANGSGWLIPTLDSRQGNTAPWLVKAAYEEYQKLGYTGLSYPTHFFTLMSAMPSGGVGSDHEPFLEKNIPAIDFTSNVNDPIHTPQDDFDHFQPSGLKQSGDLVYALVHRFDDGVPKERNDRYYLVQIGHTPIFFPLWTLSVFIALTIAFALGILLIVRRRRTEVERGQRPVLPALKLFLFALLIQSFVWLSENIVGFLKGTRYPWVAQPEGYLLLGLFAALAGIVVSLKLSPRIHLSHDPYRWFLRSFVFLLVFILLLLLINVKVALSPAVGLFFLALAMMVRRPWLKFLFWILAPHFMYRLLFSEGFDFIGRSMALHATQPMWMYAVLNAFYILFFALWSFPFLLGFAAIYFDSKRDLLWLKRWRQWSGLAGFSSAFLLCVLFLAFLPSYSDEWRSTVNIDQSVDLNTGKGKIVARSSEYLKNLAVHFPEKDTAISAWDRELLLKEFTFDRTPWIHIERTSIVTSDSNTTFDILAKIHFKYRPLSFTLTYSAGRNRIDSVSSTNSFTSSDHSCSLRWQYFPDTSIMVPIHFRVEKADSVTETIEAKFIELIEPVRIERNLTNIIPRSTIRRDEVLRAKQLQ